MNEDRYLFEIKMPWHEKEDDLIYIISTKNNIISDLSKVKDEMGDPLDYYDSIKSLCRASFIIDGGTEYNL